MSADTLTCINYLNRESSTIATALSKIIDCSMRFKFLFPLIAFLSFCVASLNAQGIVVKTLNATVVDKATSETLPGATVEGLSANGKTICAAATDDNGWISILLPDSTVSVRTSYMGYTPKVTPLPDFMPPTMTISLEPDPTLLAAVEVLASNRRDQAGKQIYTITEEMRRKSGNAATLLNLIPTVRVNPATEVIKIVPIHSE